jgi:hypothetical protein
MGSMMCGSEKKFHKRFMKFRFKVEKRASKGVIQEMCREIQWARCTTIYLREFFGGMGHHISRGMGHQVHERSWGSWLA